MSALQLSRIQHIGIPVTDLPRSQDFYQRLGFSKSMQANFTYQGDIGTAIMMQQGDIIIELYQMPKEQLAEIKKRQDGHVDHIAFDVPDIEDAFLFIQQNNFHILEDAPVFLPFWERGCKYFNILGPDGERLEFNQIL